MGLLGFSISNQIEQIGAICGFAAILGLAVLSVLYFSQAREVKRLREWAGRAPERDAELQARVTEVAARRAGQDPVAETVPPAPATTAAGATKPGLAAATAAATAAGAQAAGKTGVQGTAIGAQAAATGAQATAAGTQATGVGTQATAAGTQGAGAGAQATAAGAQATTAGAQAAAAGTQAAGAPGAQAAAGAAKGPQGVPEREVATPPVRKLPTPATAAAGATAAAAAGQARQRRTVQVGGTGAPSVSVPVAEPEEKERLVNPRAVIATVIAAVLVVGILFASGVIGGSDDKSGDKKKASSNTTPTTSTTSTTAKGGTPAVAPADTLVVVLNGTTVTGLARQAADTLKKSGYRADRFTDAADQAQQTSQVAYTDGFRDSARKIAGLLGISSRQIVPIDASTQAVAGNEASVVVTMGADKAT